MSEEESVRGVYMIVCTIVFSFWGDVEDVWCRVGGKGGKGK